MIIQAAHCLFVKLQSFVGRRGQVQIKPDHSPIVRTHDDVVARGVHVDGRQPLAATDQLLHHLLLNQVENLDMLLCDHKNIRPTRVERQSLHFARGLGEGELGLALGHLVNRDCLRAGVL